MNMSKVSDKAFEGLAAGIRITKRGYGHVNQEARVQYMWRNVQRASVISGVSFEKLLVEMVKDEAGKGRNILTSKMYTMATPEIQAQLDHAAGVYLVMKNMNVNK